MVMRKKLLSTLAMVSLTGAALMLAGCSGGPSDSEVKEAFKVVFDRETIPLAAVSKMTGSEPPELVEVNNLGCTKREPSGYACDVEVEVKFRGAAQKTAKKMNFVKGSDGWIIQG
jgi:hypothetical protein